MTKFVVGSLTLVLLLAGASAHASYSENIARCSIGSPDVDTVAQCVERAITRDRAPERKPDAEIVYIDKQCHMIVARYNDGTFGLAKVPRINKEKLEFGTLLYGKNIKKVENGGRVVHYGDFRMKNANFKVLEVGLSAKEAAQQFAEACDR